MDERGTFWRFIPHILLPLILLVLLDAAPLPHAVRSGLLEGEQARAGGQFSLAVFHFRQVMEQQPWRNDLWEDLGRMEWALGQKEQALQDLEHARGAGMLSVAGRYLLAQGLEDSEQKEAAIHIWEDLAATGAGSEQVYRHLSALYREFGRVEEATKATRAWLELGQENPEGIYQLGLLLSLSDLEEAVAQMEVAASLDPAYIRASEAFKRASGLALLSDDAAYRNTLVGRELGALGAWDLAERALLQATVDNPNYAEGWAFLGEAQGQLGKDGLAALQRAEQINPDSVLSQALLALYWSRAGAVDQALAHLSRAAALEPRQAVWQIELGALTARKGDLIAAKTYYVNAAELEPGNAQVWLEQSRFSFQYNVVLKGFCLEAAREAYRLSPDNAEVLDGLGAVMLGLGDLTSAERFLQQALSKDAGLASAHLHLGQIYLIQAKNDLARASLLRAVDLDASGSAGILAQRLLDRHFP